MHRTISGCPNNHNQHQRAIRKPNQIKNLQFIHKGIHQVSTNSTSKFTNTGKICRKIPHPPLQSHLNWKIVWQWMHSNVKKTQSHGKKNKAEIIEGYLYPINGLWRFPLHDTYQGNQQSSIIEHRTIKHCYQHIKPMAPSKPRAYHPTPQKDLSIFYHQFICCPKNHPASDNQWWILHNMVRTHSKTNSKNSPRVINHVQMEPRLT